jgi:hypothetical protein
MCRAQHVLGKAVRVKKGKKLACSGVSNNVYMNIKVTDDKQLATHYHQKLKKIRELCQKLAVAALRRLGWRSIDDSKANADRVALEGKHHMLKRGSDEPHRGNSDPDRILCR